VRVLACATLGACSLAFPASGQAYVVQGRAWPGGVVRYYSAAPDQAWALQQAVDAWNESGAHVHFVAVPESEAQVVVEHLPVACASHAAASVGYGRGAHVYISRLDGRSPFCNRFMSARALAHELGHVLGLGHEVTGCAAMNPQDYLQGPSLCPRAERWEWRCRLLEPDDVAGAIAIYGGYAVPQEGSGDCDLYAASRPPSGLEVGWTTVPGQLRVSFRRPPSARIPAFLVGRVPEAFQVAFAAGSTCPADPTGLTHYRWDVPAGGTQVVGEMTSPGTYCLAVWADDAYGRPSRAAALVVKA
jgi:hypothetical protein